MKRTVIHTESAPPAVGPYSQAIRAGELVFVSGQLGIDPSTKKMSGDDTASQTRTALANLKAILETAGSSMDDIVKATIYLADIGDFSTVNEIYADSFSSEEYPARAAFQVAALPLGGRVEIEAVAIAR
jgi:2-iminobutanoate/2-iminopropanoate deaminase